MSAGVRARRAGVLFRDVTIKIPDSGCDQGCEWRHAPEAWAEIWKSQLVELSFWLGRRRLTFACSPKPGQWLCSRCRTWFGADGKVRCISLLKLKNLFRVSGLLCYLYVRYEHFMYISHIHVWLCYKNNPIKICVVKNQETYFCSKIMIAAKNYFLCP